MKKKILIGTLSSIGIILILLLGGGYMAYNKAGDYLVEKALSSQMTEDFMKQTGINLSEAGRVLTKEEVETFKDVPAIKAKINNVPTEESSPIQSEEVVITTDDLKETLQKQVKEVIDVVPSSDKRAMTNLVMSNLKAGDINYLMGLVLDGVSGSDLAEAKRIAIERFDGAELEIVQSYYEQYKHLLP